MTHETLDLRSWVKRLRTLHPEIGDVLLAGSRAHGTHRDDSDYDIVIVVDDADEEHERQITADCQAPGIDLFFLRPPVPSRYPWPDPSTCRLKRWDPPPTDWEVRHNNPVMIEVWRKLDADGVRHGLIDDEAVDAFLVDAIRL